MTTVARLHTQKTVTSLASSTTQQTLQQILFGFQHANVKGAKGVLCAGNEHNMERYGMSIDNTGRIPAQGNLGK